MSRNWWMSYYHKMIHQTFEEMMKERDAAKMSKRMTDSRLSVFEQNANLLDRWHTELLQAMKAERKEVERLKTEQADFEYNASQIIEAAEAKLAQAEETLAFMRWVQRPDSGFMTAFLTAQEEYAVLQEHDAEATGEGD